MGPGSSRPGPRLFETLGEGRPPSEHIVGAVAERLVVGALATAQIEGAGAFGHEAVRLQCGDLVRAVAERLLGRASAAAPEVGLPGLERDLVGALLSADRLVRHVLPSPGGGVGPSGSDTMLRSLLEPSWCQTRRV